MKWTLASCMLLATIMFMDILGGAEIDLFTPSFPELQDKFDLSPFLVEGLLSINLIGFCFSLFFIGGLADRYGRRIIILIGLIVFSIASIFCVFAESYNVLLIGRFFQGVGVAAPATLCFLIVADSYPIKQQQYLYSLLNGLVSISIAVAPIIGSIITIHYYWQGNFIALLILGVIVLCMTLIFVPNYTLKKVEKDSFLSGYFSILKSKEMNLMIVNIVSTFVVYWVFVGITPVLYMNDLGLAISQFGLYQGGGALVFAVGCIISGPIIKKYNQKIMLVYSYYLSIAALIVFLLIAFLDVKDPLLITLSFAFYSIGTIIPIIIIYPICINFKSYAKAKTSSMIGMMRLIFTAIGLQIMGYCYNGTFQNIGIILSVSILVSVVTLFFIIRNNKIMEFSIE